MNVAIKKAKLYVKLVLIALVVIMAVVVLVMNYTRNADVWFFKGYENVNVLKLLLVTAVISIVSFWILTRLHRLVYAAALLGALHFIWLVKADLLEPLVYTAIIVSLLLYRLRRA